MAENKILGLSPNPEASTSIGVSISNLNKKIEKEKGGL
jgi:hypothetical protein